MELTGIVTKVTRVNGLQTPMQKDWVRFDVLINYIQGEYPKDACVSFNGKKFTAIEFVEGKTITVKFDITSKYKDDKCRTRLDAFNYKINN